MTRSSSTKGVAINNDDILISGAYVSERKTINKTPAKGRYRSSKASSPSAYRISDNTPTGPNRFSRLPAELRNYIYEFTVSEEKEINLLHFVFDGEFETMMSAKRPSIAQASRQTRNEATPLYLANNDFVAYVTAENFRFLIVWLGLFSKQELQYLRKLNIVFEGNCLNWHANLGKGPEPKIENWSTLLACLSELELKSTQLHHLTLGEKYIRSVLDSKRTTAQKIKAIGIQMGAGYLFNIFVLKPLLALYSLDDSTVRTDAQEIKQDVSLFAAISYCDVEWNEMKQWADEVPRHLQHHHMSGAWPPRWFKDYAKELARESVAKGEIAKEAQTWRFRKSLVRASGYAAAEELSQDIKSSQWYL